MKILLDECLNWRLRDAFGAHDVFTVKDMRWSGKTNGELLKVASENGFDVFVTIDKQLQFQQSFQRFKLILVVFQVQTSRIEFIRPLIPAVVKQLPFMKAGEVYEFR